MTWTLDAKVDYLNHGSFGACPAEVLEHQAALRARMEREPVDFLVRALPGLLAEARERLGAFVGAHPDDLAFVPNATTAVNTVLRSTELRAGDELLTTDHAYASCRNAMKAVAEPVGAKVVVAHVPFPIAGEDQAVEPLLAAVSPRTRLAVLDHVASPTALVFPLARLVRELSARGVEVVVDGAHALGQVPLDLDALGAAYYTGNGHKWLCAPKGAAFLHVRRDRQAGLRPLVVSHGQVGGTGGSRFRAEFDWTGTDDPTAALSIPACIGHLGSLLPGGWPELMARNHALALEARKIVGEALRVAPACPEAMVGSMAAIPLPAGAPGSVLARLDHEQAIGWFRQRGVETWLFPWPDASSRLVRVSAQLYNRPEQYRRLAGLLAEALRTTP